jgi:hypothetical protein
MHLEEEAEGREGLGRSKAFDGLEHKAKDLFRGDGRRRGRRL